MDEPKPPHRRGRGAVVNPVNRFEALHLARDEYAQSPEDPLPGTRFFKDSTKSILSYNDSPDVGFNVGINPYRGCEHGCVYCYARPSHEYLGFSSGTDFESNIMVKENAPALLRIELSRRSWKPQVIALSGNTDCYQPAERRFQLTRACLQVLAEFRNPAGVITKNFLVTRDIDVLQELARHGAAAVFVSITSLDESVARVMEPRASRPAQRLEAIRRLAAAGVPVGVMVAPMVPGLTDHEAPAILKAAAEAGATFAGHTVLRLPHGVKEIFDTWLDQHFPDRKKKVLHRLREVHDGALDDSRFGSRMRGEGVYADQLNALFEAGRRQAGLTGPCPRLSAAHFRPPGGRQLSLL